MSRPASSPSSSRTRQINTLLALVLAACLGVIYLDQTGKMGGGRSGQAPAPTQTQPGTDITTPDLNSTTAPASPSSDPATPETTAPDTSSTTPPSTPAPAGDQTTAPASPTDNSGYGDLK